MTESDLDEDVPGISMVIVSVTVLVFVEDLGFGFGVGFGVGLTTGFEIAAIEGSGEQIL